MLPNRKLYLNFLKHAGLYTFINSEDEKKSSLFLFYCALLSFSTVPIIYTFYSMSTEILNLVNILIYLVPLCQVTLKIIVFFIYLSPIKRLTLIFDENYLNCNRKLRTNRKIFEKKMFGTNQVCYMYMFVCYVNVIFWLCMPIIRSAYLYKLSGYVNKVMEFVYPFNYSASPVYEMIVLYETAVMIVYFMVLVSQDLLFVVFVSMFCGQIETIKSSISSLRRRNLKTTIRSNNNNKNSRNTVKPRLDTIFEGGGGDNSILQNYNNDNTSFRWTDVNGTGTSCFQRKYGDDHYNFLIEIIKDHQKLMTTSQQLLCVFNPVMNIQLLASILGVCLITFKMSETESVHQTAFECGWYRADKKFCQALLFLSLRSQRPVRLTAWKVFYMDLTIFVMVLRVSYSYYTLLRSISGN